MWLYERTVVVWVCIMGLVTLVQGEEGDTSTDVIAACVDVDGKMHRLGESYIGPDKCNTCRCLEGGSACTKKFCPPNFSSREAEANKCVDNRGVLHDEGQSYQHVDGCNTCKCTKLGGACTRRFCHKQALCVDTDGNQRKIGDTAWQHKDGCNQCLCGPLGNVCTEMTCPSILQPRTQKNQTVSANGVVDESGDQPCEDYQGNTRFPGSVWLTGDSCNNCMCPGNGSLPVCTKMGCRVRLERLTQSDISSPSVDGGVPSLHISTLAFLSVLLAILH